MRVQVTHKVEEFYNRDDVSRMMPGKNDTVGKVQKRVMVDYLQNVYTKFSSENPKYSKGLFTPKTRFFVCSGNSAADISKPHTFKWDPLADEVLEAA